MIDISDTCLNDAIYAYKIPFEYRGKPYYKCTIAGGYKTSWCYEVRRSSNLKFCSNCYQDMWV